MTHPQVALLHYTAPPIIGGVEAVIQAHTKTFLKAGYPVTIIAGRGEKTALPLGVEFVLIPEVDSQHPDIEKLSAELEAGRVPPAFEPTVNRLIEALSPVLDQYDHLLVHNILTKHFNLPLTAALHHLVDGGVIHHCIAWCHDMTWTSPNSRSKVHPGYPWDLLRIQHPRMTYVAVSQQRQHDLAALFECPPEQIQVIYNGVEAELLLGLSAKGQELARRLELLQSDLILIMPVRVTQAKNIEYSLQLLASLKQSGYRIKLIVTGPPDPHDARNMAYFYSLQILRREMHLEAEMHFIYESGPDPNQPFLIEAEVVADLLRLSDILLMPSHREGFGMPVRKQVFWASRSSAPLFRPKKSAARISR
jgi:glycosyltransferase involved in cell wall biosynthesis